MAKEPEQQTDSVLLAAFEGVKNTVTRERLKPSQLERARNVDIDDALQPRRRRGYTLRSAGNFHSIYTSPAGMTFGVKDGLLCRIKPDYSVQSLGDGGDDPIAYIDVGDTIYYSSADVSGKILPDLTVQPWGQRGGDGLWLSPVINPTETLGAVGGKYLRKPPMARWLAYLNGRIYLATGSTLWATELYLYDFVDSTKTFFQFESPITGISNGTDGLYVGTESAVWFLSGPLNQLKRDLVISAGCIAGSMISAPADLLRSVGEPATQHRNATLFMTEQGLIAGFDNGMCMNLTKSETLFPQATSVVPLFRTQDGINQYVAVMDSGGTPSAGTRIGDYVDAEIRRFQS
jgi:hypothetical protein